jgi:hypothetical protein
VGSDTVVTFAAAASANGGETGMVKVALISMYGEVSTADYRVFVDPEIPWGWWDGPDGIDAPAPVGGPIAVGTGICGDDALVAYAREIPEGPHTTTVARVRGAAYATHDVFSGWSPQGHGLSIATRGVGQ